MVGLFLILSISLNYYFDFEDGYIDQFSHQPIWILCFLGLHVFSYYGTSFLQAVGQQNYAIFKNKQFWIFSLIGLGILSIQRGFPFAPEIANAVFSPRALNFGYRLIYNVKDLWTVIPPLLLVYFLTRQKEDSFYGVTLKNAKIAPYFILLLLMVPLIYWASLQPSFLEVYPRYRGHGVHNYWNVKEGLVIGIFELGYGLGFFTVEILFRGFLMIGLARWIGKDALLPMVTTYAFIHFGKPLGETISSIFGGYILGILAIYSRNIWGGIIVHLGIAWLMEIAAFWQKTN